VFRMTLFRLYVNLYSLRTETVTMRIANYPNQIFNVCISYRLMQAKLVHVPFTALLYYFWLDRAWTYLACTCDAKASLAAKRLRHSGESRRTNVCICTPALNIMRTNFCRSASVGLAAQWTSVIWKNIHCNESESF